MHGQQNIKNKNVENLCTKYSVAFFTYKTKRTEQDGRPTVATATTPNTPALSTVFEISRVVYQLLRFNNGSFNLIRDYLFLCVSVCGKQNYL